MSPRKAPAIGARGARMTEPCFGMLLAGGQATRMGGGDKALLPLGGRRLLDHAAARLARQCAGLVLNANGDPARFAAYGWPVIADDLPGHPGPLAGILAALDWIAASAPGVAWAVSLAADTPFVPEDYVARLLAAAMAAGAPLACARSGGQTHPVNGLWRVDLRGDLRRALVDEGVRKIDRWTARHGCVAVDWPDQPRDPFFNINTPADLAAAQAMIALETSG